MDARGWILRFAEQIGVPAPSEPEVGATLERRHHGARVRADRRAGRLPMAAAAGLMPAVALRAAREVSTGT